MLVNSADIWEIVNFASLSSLLSVATTRERELTWEEEEETEMSSEEPIERFKPLSALMEWNLSLFDTIWSSALK